MFIQLIMEDYAQLKLLKDQTSVLLILLPVTQEQMNLDLLRLPIEKSLKVRLQMKLYIPRSFP